PRCDRGSTSGRGRESSATCGHARGAIRYAAKCSVRRASLGRAPTCHSDVLRSCWFDEHAEDWRDLVGAYLDAASAAVAEMGGYVAKKLGDGIMALFGYPVAHENDAERAARAALSIQRALAEVNRNNAGRGKPALNARIGIETGPVVVDAAG